MTKVILLPSRNLRTTAVRQFVSRSLVQLQMAMMIVASAFLATLAMPFESALAQQAPLHLNPAVEKLARGEGHHRHANR